MQLTKKEKIELNLIQNCGYFVSKEIKNRLLEAGLVREINGKLTGKPEFDTNEYPPIQTR
jgi:hypothetical protein